MDTYTHLWPRRENDQPDDQAALITSEGIILIVTFLRLMILEECKAICDLV